MLVVLGAIDAVVPPPFADVGGEVVPELGDELFPRRAEVRRLGEGVVEVEQDGLDHQVILAER